MDRDIIHLDIIVGIIAAFILTVGILLILWRDHRAWKRLKKTLDQMIDDDRPTTILSERVQREIDEIMQNAKK